MDDSVWVEIERYLMTVSESVRLIFLDGNVTNYLKF